jgi:hypothetical protein
MSGQDSHEAKYAAYAAREAEAFASNKEALFEALDRHGIATVTVSFDGYGDEGQIQSIEVDGNTDAVPNIRVSYREIHVDQPEAKVSDQPLEEVLRTLVFDCLAETHEYWEDNEGAFGEVIFDTANRSITLDFNERFVDSTNYQHEF